jgi:hypothetical protein
MVHGMGKRWIQGRGLPRGGFGAVEVARAAQGDREIDPRFGHVRRRGDGDAEVAHARAQSSRSAQRAPAWACACASSGDFATQSSKAASASRSSPRRLQLERARECGLPCGLVVHYSSIMTAYYIQRASREFAARDLPAALESCRRAVEDPQAGADAWFLLATLHMAMGTATTRLRARPRDRARAA